MNTTESIVESYFRLVRDCFTQPDVKVIKGNNRQLDLLAYNIQERKSYHVEVSVTHCRQWCPTPEELKGNFDRKFFGLPSKKKGDNTDYVKGKTYTESIKKTYKSLGLDYESINRVWVCWTVKDADRLELELREYCKKLRIPLVEVVSFRDEVIPSLMDKVSTSNYEDDSLRTLSLLRQYELQKPNR
ncbi:MAG: hypothetical protein OQK04_11535 [Kangiellaceae bacterium]|nr:hypothetical protein [Kangiellaceae bacterium]MCW8999335.1 hypothetical protein [Kangiellaceae bacterium]